MSEEEIAKYVSKTSKELRQQIKDKLKDIRDLISAEAKTMRKTGGSNTVETILCAVECTNDQVEYAFSQWNSSDSGENDDLIFVQ